ncbi:hypothetical protein ENSA5_14170 [Enhygromyxa salina]|uniref:Uncharacterized protein n=1 Tax=Enhygromyxa salina TaxID=215803 RepID=A0A2S9YEQ9_9BACT|nr:hypothetical protein ENSA5_14170 [Enhygromyxa salina]
MTSSASRCVCCSEAFIRRCRLRLLVPPSRDVLARRVWIELRLVVPELRVFELAHLVRLLPPSLTHPASAEERAPGAADTSPRAPTPTPSSTSARPGSASPRRSAIMVEPEPRTAHVHDLPRAPTAPRRDRAPARARTPAASQRPGDSASTGPARATPASGCSFAHLATTTISGLGPPSIHQQRQHRVADRDPRLEELQAALTAELGQRKSDQLRDQRFAVGSQTRKRRQEQSWRRLLRAKGGT